jgi:hypothetical protein
MYSLSGASVYVSVFCRFLLQTFGREVLASGSGVLDVAGGRGDLAFELLNLNGIRATVVDPRQPRLNKFCLWLKARPWIATKPMRRLGGGGTTRRLVFQQDSGLTETQSDGRVGWNSMVWVETGSTGRAFAKHSATPLLTCTLPWGKSGCLAAL